MPLFSAHEIVKRYDRHLALDHVTVSVPEGSVFGLLGPNGAGKTTLLRIVNQITLPDEGTLEFEGRPLTRNDISAIGYLPEERGLYKKMKVGEQALYLARLKGLSRADAMQRIRYWFEKFEIQSWWDRKVEELSKGMAQKVQFITTVLHKPRLLIFDEPFSGFDPINTNLLKAEIQQLKKEGCTIIFSTHNMASVEELCEHIALINSSRVILDGQVAAIKQRFKPNAIRIDFRGEAGLVRPLLPDECQLLSIAETDGQIEMALQYPESIDSNKLLNIFTSRVHVTAFNEIMPSMDEIFIRTVGESNLLTNKKIS